MFCETYHATISPEVCKGRQARHTMHGGDPWCSTGRCEQGKAVLGGKLMKEKKCSLCGLIKPMTDYYRQAKSKDGRRSECAACTQAKQANRDKNRAPRPREERRAKAAERLAVVPGPVEAARPMTTPAEKTCSRCGIVKPMAEFHKSSERPDGRRGVCKTCRNLAVNQGYRASLERGRMILDFSGREEILAFITQAAEREFRTPENQVLFWINEAMDERGST